MKSLLSKVGKVFGGKKKESESSSNDWEALKLPYGDKNKCITLAVEQEKDINTNTCHAKCDISGRRDPNGEELRQTAGITFIQTGDGDDKRLTVMIDKLVVDKELSKKLKQKSLTPAPIRNLTPENNVTMTFYQDNNGRVESISFQYSVRDTSRTKVHQAGQCAERQATLTQKAYATFYLDPKQRVKKADFDKILDGAVEHTKKKMGGGRLAYVARLYQTGELKHKKAEAEAKTKRQAEAAAEAEAAEKARIAAEAEAAEKARIAAEEDRLAAEARAAAEQARIVAAEEAQKAAEQAEQDQVDSAQAELDRKKKLLDKRIFEERRKWFKENRDVDLKEIQGNQFLRRLAANEPMENDFTLFCTLPLLVIFVFWFKRYIVTSKDNDDNEIVEDNVSGDENDLNNIV